jgi:membrane-associated phospholipid phosphatase
MSPLVVDLLVALPPAAAAYLLTRRWPHRNLDAPRLPATTVITEMRRHPRVRRLVHARLDPAVGTGLLLSVASVVAVSAMVGVGFLVRMIHSNSGLARYDGAFARWGARNATAASTSGLKLVSVLGGYQTLVVASLIVVVLEYRRGLGRSVVALLVLVVGGQFAVVNSVKALVGRTRPDISRLTGFAGSSFPSGHAAAAAASYAAFSLLLGRRRSARMKAVFAAAAAAIAAAVAASRVLLGVHWFTDVLAGAAIGWIWFTVISIAFGGRILRFGAPVAQADTAEASVATTA